jgi:hypothetical protein
LQQEEDVIAPPAGIPYSVTTMTTERTLLEVYDGGPLDGERVPLAGASIMALDGGVCYVYRLVAEDDGTRFYRLHATVLVEAA